MTHWPKAVLFDFDGVIVHSEPLHYQAFAEVLATRGVELSKEEYYRSMIGFDDDGCFRSLFRMRNLPLDGPQLRELMRMKQQRMIELIHSGAFHALPGAEALIKRLAERGVPMAICSGALRDEIVRMLEGIGLREYFPIIVAAEDVDVGKPDPRGYRLVTRRLSEKLGLALEPADCLVIEDAPTVARAVRAAGFPVLGVATSYGIEDLSHANWAVPSLKLEHLSAAVPPLQWLCGSTSAS